MTEIFKWLGSLSPDTAGSAIGAFFAAFLLAAVTRVKAHAEKARQKGYAKVEAEAKAERAAASGAPPKQALALPSTFSIPAPVKALDVRLSELERQARLAAEWSADELRARIRHLEAAYADVSKDATLKGIALASARSDLEHADEDAQRRNAENVQLRADNVRKDSEIERLRRRIDQLQRIASDGDRRLREAEETSPHTLPTVPPRRRT